MQHRRSNATPPSGGGGGPTPIPEPSSLVLLSIGMVTLVGHGLRRRRKQTM
ncbi:MAG: PEP-CTERM sorting domain-containing protein [Fuerstiella sp.]|nr:PEP-CTERM sorting domain-containing protein [Fuerstiella sp.]MCP4858391.1 PEP-CTERM sorting domain-containing protein [Fuerstiella sp.]